MAPANPRALWLGLLPCLCLLLVSPVARAAGEDIATRTVTLPAARHPVTATRFVAAGDAPRPAVLLLHGRQGLTPFADFYRRQALALARAGLDAYLFTYYDETDPARANDPVAATRQALFRERAPAWAALVRDVVGDVLADARSSGRVGLLGFSQGGFLAVGVAGADPRIDALVVCYGGVPDVFRDAVRRLPPLLELHGDADDVVPPAQGKALVDLARRLGQSAAMTVFPGAGHGFSGEDARKAQALTVNFLGRRLGENAD
ncbi:dienelactone hydrolase family protein [Solidesulfovibrio sp.]|uniref:dienelactone hydrolase family protein n=1 Tax=Solidesulfovibrio sp. TaxID=2910990 RepID=UPI00260CCF44|nr:dienelactone hydrolase family protein [Solidesulfovibrio sp.]